LLSDARAAAGGGGGAAQAGGARGSAPPVAVAYPVAETYAVVDDVGGVV